MDYFISDSDGSRILLAVCSTAFYDSRFQFYEMERNGTNEVCGAG